MVVMTGPRHAGVSVNCESLTTQSLHAEEMYEPEL